MANSLKEMQSTQEFFAAANMALAGLKELREMFDEIYDDSCASIPLAA